MWPDWLVWRHVLLAALATIVNCHGWSEDTDDLVSTIDVEAVLGRSAALPCNIEPDTKEDRVYMVLWFRHSGGKPLYSFDVRGRGFSKALYWSDPQVFGPRAYFVTMSKPATLTIESVQLDDEDVYRCRVDFKNSPTRNFQIRLVVIVPPTQLLLYDTSGRDVAGVVGPLEEGSDLILVCELRGGRPQPTLTWAVNGRPAPHHTIVKTDGRLVVSRLQLKSIDRSYLNTSVKCQATNTQLLSPHERTATVEMNLRPTSVRITVKPAKLSADDAVALRCEALGSRPPAQLVWFRENRRLSKGKQTEFSNDTMSVSTLSLVALPEDDGALLRCRADNPALPDSPLEDSFRMNVVYRPVLGLTLGSTLNPNDIKEGDDVYFECNIKANPKEHRISWYHNDRQVTQNMSSGVIISTKSLVLQRVRRQDGGLYTCRAANQIGESTSQPVYLRVQYAPVCASLGPLVVGARLDEALRVRCTVSADPSDVVFYWQFNNSGESFQVSPARYVSMSGTTSELRYRAASERDYGALLCRATNSVGQQRRACVFQIVPAARPSPPRNCTTQREVRGSTEGFLIIQCLASYDGGLNQHFLLEASVEGVKKTILNTSASDVDHSVRFNVSWVELRELGERASLLVVARNSKGASDPVMLENVIFGDAEKRTDGVTRAASRFPLAAAVAAVATLLVAACAVVGIAVKRRDISRGTKRPSQSVVQVDSQGRQYVIAYPGKQDTLHADGKPDILNPKPEMQPPRVILESYNSKSYFIKEVERSPESDTLWPEVTQNLAGLNSGGPKYVCPNPTEPNYITQNFNEANFFCPNSVEQNSQGPSVVGANTVDLNITSGHNAAGNVTGQMPGPNQLEANLGSDQSLIKDVKDFAMTLNSHGLSTSNELMTRR